jgi:hypothetical protein
MPRRTDIVTIVQGVDLGFTLSVDYDGPLTLSAPIVLTDDLTIIFDGHLTIDDTFAMSDDVLVLVGLINLDEVVGLIDSGSISSYDYAGLDYFETPLDYVGNARVF